MDPLRLLIDNAGFFTRGEALATGYDDRDIAHAVRSGTWIRFRRGYYTFRDQWDLLDDIGRHRVRSSAVLRSLGDGVALSHQSGVVRHDLDAWGLDLSRVHVTRLDGGPGRVEGDVVHHEGSSEASDVVRIAGQQVLRAERCALEAASRVNNEVALALLDAGLRDHAFDTADLYEQFSAMERWPFMRHLHIPVRMADARAGSIGESRGRWWFYALGIPMPELQFEVFDAEGNLIGVADWCWPQYKLLGESDGKIKYGRLLKPGEAPGDAAFREKRREDLMREATGFGMLRFIWSDYNNPRSVLARFNRLAGRAS